MNDEVKCITNILLNNGTKLKLGIFTNPFFLSLVACEEDEDINTEKKF